MKILIIGKRNPSFLLIGKSLRENIKQSKIHYVSDSYLNTPFSFTKINLRSASLINEVINDFNPDFILHNIPLSLDKKSLFCEEFNINKILTEIKSSLLEINLSEKTLTDVIPLFDNIDKRVIINYDKFSVLDLQLLLEYLQKKDFNNFILKVSKPNADLSKLLNYKIPFLFEIFSMDDLILKLNSIRQLKQNNIIIPIIKAKNEVHDIIFKLIKERVFTIFLETPIKLDFLKREEYSNFEVKFIKNNSYLPNYNFFLNKEKKEVRRNILKIQKVKEQLLCEFNILNDYNILKNDLKDKQNKLNEIWSNNFDLDLLKFNLNELLSVKQISLNEIENEISIIDSSPIDLELLQLQLNSKKYELYSFLHSSSLIKDSLSIKDFEHKSKELKTKVWKDFDDLEIKLNNIKLKEEYEDYFIFIQKIESLNKKKDNLWNHFQLLEKEETDLLKNFDKNFKELSYLNKEKEKLDSSFSMLLEKHFEPIRLNLALKKSENADLKIIKKLQQEKDKIWGAYLQDIEEEIDIVKSKINELSSSKEVRPRLDLFNKVINEIKDKKNKINKDVEKAQLKINYLIDKTPLEQIKLKKEIQDIVKSKGDLSNKISLIDSNYEKEKNRFLKKLKTKGVLKKYNELISEIDLLKASIKDLNNKLKPFFDKQNFFIQKKAFLLSSNNLEKKYLELKNKINILSNNPEEKKLLIEVNETKYAIFRLLNKHNLLEKFLKLDSMEKRENSKIQKMH
jgi:hypothetical protein